MSGWLTALVYGLLSVAVLTVFVFMVRTGKLIRCLLSSFVQGMCAIAAVDIVGVFTGVSLGFGWLNLLCCTAFGTPGVVGLLLARWVSL